MLPAADHTLPAKGRANGQAPGGSMYIALYRTHLMCSPLLAWQGSSDCLANGFYFDPMES